MSLPERKNIRLKEYDYSAPGAYHIVLCTKDRKRILSTIVGTAVLGCPQNNLTKYGKIAQKQILAMSDFYKEICVDKFVIMPDHMHILLRIECRNYGQPGTAAPTNKRTLLANFVRTFKRFCNKEYGENIWQRSYFDHVIRNRQDYEETWNYIESNPYRWVEKHIL